MSREDEILELLKAEILERGNLQRELAALRAEIHAVNTPATADGWLDSKAAREYMGISKSTFEKYRYQTKVRIKGYNLEGKTLFKKKDLDNFIYIYELRSNGVA